jgi:WD40 repeat protein/DNA-binding SARP family transcriptional activator
VDKNLTLKLLGSPQISLDGQPLTHFISRKAQALLIYIAMTGKLHSREMLAELFWQNMPSRQSLKNLRTVLPNLRQQVGSHLIITRQTIEFNRACSYRLDVEALQAIAAHPKTANLQVLSEAVTQYQGDFLEGFYVPDAPEFENWALMERERLRELAIDGLHNLAEQYLQQQNYTAGLTITRKLLALDPWRETAHQQQMIFFACTGQRRAAQAQYEACRQILANEFDVEPMAETIGLYERICSGDICGATATHEKTPPIASSSQIFNPGLAYLLTTQYDWGEAIDVSIFYGRETELATLQQWMVQDHYRLILLLGMGGIGKTALSVKLAQTVQAKFEYVIWRSLRNAPPLESLLADLVPFLSDQQDSKADIGRLLHWLRSHRCLMILDNVETLFQEGNRAGQYRPGYENYSELFKVIGEVQHQSCVLLTSREKLAEVAAMEGNQSVQTFPVVGSSTTAQALLERRGLIGSSVQKQQLAERYGYNPFALKIVASSIQDLLDGDIEEFLKQEMVLFNGIRRLLEQQFERLSTLEQSILRWLAINREWTTISELATDTAPPVPRAKLLEVLESLSWRNLIECRQGSYTLQPVVMEYVTDRLVEQVGNEIVNQKIDVLGNHALLKTNVKEYIKETQQRLIVAGIATQLQTSIETPAKIETQFQEILSLLQSQPASMVYAAGNLINLSCHLQLDLTGYDFSRLTLRNAQLQGQWLQSVNFQDSQFEASLFTQIVKISFSLAFSPDGKLLANGDSSGNIFVRRVVDGQLLLSWQGHCNTIWTLVWSPDGETFATGSNDGTIRIWNPHIGQCLQSIQASSVVWTVAWSPAGNSLASIGTEETLRLWDVNTGQCVQGLDIQKDWGKAVVWSPDGQFVASGGDDGTIKFWHPQTGRCVQTLSGHHNGVWCLAWNPHPDRPLLASSSADHTIRLWNPNTGQCLQTLEGHTNTVLRVAWSPAGDTLASSSDDHTIRLWDGQTGQCLRILQGHQHSVWAIAWNPVQPLLASGSADYTTRFWQPQTGDCLKSLQGYSAGIRSLAWSPDSQTLAAGSDDHSIRLWNIATGDCLKKMRGQSNQIWSLAWSPDGQTIASGSDDKTLELWNPHTGQRLQTLVGHTNWIWSVAWSAEGQRLISGSNDQSIRVWDRQTGHCLQCLQCDAWVLAIAPSPAGNILASGGADCVVWLYDLNTGACLKKLPGHHSWIWSIAWSPDGQMLATGSEDGTLRLWDRQTGDCLKVLPASQMRIFSVGWSPDGQRVACGGADSTVQIWDVNTGQCVQRLEGHTNSLWSVAWQPAGHLLASCGADDLIRIWEVDTGKCVRILQTDRPYEGMNITGVVGLTEAQTATLKALGAVELS